MSAVAAARARALAVPVGVWLGAIVLASIALRVELGRRVAAPWIMVDEIVYSQLAQSFAASGAFLVRGVPSHGYGVVYPVVIAPAWRLFGAMPSVYAAAKTINAVVMSLAAIPAYYLARRLLPVGLSLAVAGLTVLVPEMLYTGMIMTENVFYPLFVAFALLFVVTLERPTVGRQVGLIVLFALIYETRAQAVALLPAMATAPVLLALVRREGARDGVRRFAVLYGILAAGVVVALAVTAVRGRSPSTLLGAYGAATSSTYTVSGVAHYALYHLAGLDLALGIIPFAALVAIWLSPRQGGQARAAFAVGSFSIALWLIPEVAAFASQTSVLRIEERNLFYLDVFALVALLAMACEGLVPRRGRAALIAAVLAGVLPFFIPFTRFLTTSAVSDTFEMLPWWWVQDHWITLQQVRWAAGGVSLVAAAAFLLARGRAALVLAALVGAYFVATTAVVANGRHGIEVAARGSVWAGTHEPHYDWVDRAVGRGASVALLWTANASPYTVWENEFFNRSIRTVYALDGAPKPDPLPETPATRSRSGVVVSRGRAVRAAYVLADSSVALAARPVAEDTALGMTLYRVGGPVVLLPPPTKSGLYPGGTWSGPSVTYTQADCPGGKLAVTLQSDARLFPTPQTLVAREDGRVVGTTRVAPTGEPVFTIPLIPGADGRCSVRFTVGRTAIPARVERGSTDPRRLGLHFLLFRPSR